MSSLQYTDEEHQAIYDAVAKRDVEKARTVLAGHISSVKSQVLTGVSKRQERERFRI